MLVVGKTGVGKSTTANRILGFDAFETGAFALSVTPQIQYNESTRNGRKLLVMDTPGFCDTNLSEEKVKAEISKWSSIASPGIHAIILVVQVERITLPVEETVERIMKIFGEDLKDFLIVIFTNIEKLERVNKTVDDFVKSMDKSSNLSRLIDASNGRYIGLGYKEKMEDDDPVLKELLSMIEKNKGKEGKLYYSIEKFQKQQIAQEKERKYELEVKKKEKMYTLSELKTLSQTIQSRKSYYNFNINFSFNVHF